MKKLYVIGNGFDLAHGLPTKYWHFRQYLNDHHPNFLHFFEGMYDISFPAKEFWNTLENGMGYPDTISMESFAENILSDMGLDPPNTGIRDTMNDYWEGEYGFIRKLQIYLKEWISSINLEHVEPRKAELKSNNKDLFLNFNYTETLEKVYGIDDVLHIHGSVGENTDSDPIMGHGNRSEILKRTRLVEEAENIHDEGSASIQLAITHYLERTFKDTDRIIFDNSYFFEKLIEVDHVVIFGWSIGESDVPYLRKIIDSGLPFKKWTIYYHKEEDLNSIKDTLIKNMPPPIYEKSEIEFLQSDSFWDQ